MCGLGFAQPVAPTGYAWWYLDVVSDDAKHALSIIALLGSVFSPYYARARASGPADALAHSAINVALYGPGGREWVLTERGASAVTRSETELSIGPSSVALEREAIVFRFDETTSPFPSLVASRISGQVRVFSYGQAGPRIALDSVGKHRWAPHVLGARAEVTLARPALRFSGSAYIDANAGDEALEDGFRRWTWSRATGGGHTMVAYDVVRRDGTARMATMLFLADAMRDDPPPLAAYELGRTGWGLDRQMHAEPGRPPGLMRTLEDTPFYARSLVATEVRGAAGHAVHESLSLDRFRQSWVRMLLPFRMRRDA